MPVTEYTKVLDRPIRKGDHRDQLVPTYVEIGEAITDARLDEALEYIDFFDSESAHVRTARVAASRAKDCPSKGWATP